MSAPPTKYVRYDDFTTFAAANPDKPLPGVSVDQELNRLKTTSDAIIDRASEIQRADGALANSIVTPDALSASVKASITVTGSTPRGLWLTTISYAIKDIVSVASGAVYVAMVAHVAGVFATDLAAGKWMVIANATFNQSLNTTDSPSFVAITTSGAGNIGGNLTVTGTSHLVGNTTMDGALALAGKATIGDLAADTVIGRMRYNEKTMNVTVVTDFFTVPLVIDNTMSHFKIKLSAYNAGVNTGYASTYEEWTIAVGSNGGAYKAPVVVNKFRDQESNNAGLITVGTTVTATIVGNVLTVKITINTFGGTGFTQGVVSAHIEAIGHNHAAQITAV